MGEKQTQRLNDLATELVIGREFAPLTPHTYAHPLGRLAAIGAMFNDLPETKLVFGRFPEFSRPEA